MSRAVTVEVNARTVTDPTAGGVPTAAGVLMITPPITEDYWLARVPLGGGQAIVCFPKFMTIGIGFQRETDWNTNLPYSCPDEEIYEHIKHNQGRRCRASKAVVLDAIRLIQAWAAAYKTRARS